MTMDRSMGDVTVEVKQGGNCKYIRAYVAEGIMRIWEDTIKLE
ncbi:MAG: hypothetical protein R2777_07715 [Chitinophagales bacterium]